MPGDVEYLDLEAQIFELFGELFNNGTIAFVERGMDAADRGICDELAHQGGSVSCRHNLILELFTHHTSIGLTIY